MQCDAIDVGRHVAAGSVELAYLDPPFAVGKAFGARTRRGEHRARGAFAYDDTWPSLDAYLAWLEARLRVVYTLLSARGTMWLHLDHRAVHEAKVLCDGVFGRAHFLGEIIWGEEDAQWVRATRKSVPHDPAYDEREPRAAMPESRADLRRRMRRR